MTTVQGFDAGAPAVPPGGGVVAADVPCRKCQYNLRGLSVDGRCPECGTPVGFSIRGDFLCYSEPGWVLTLRRGVTAMLYAILVTIAGTVAGAVLRGLGFGRVPAAVFGLGGAALSLAGAWLLTTPDPSGLGEDRYGTSRKVIRALLAVAVAEEGIAMAKLAGNWPPGVALALTVLTLVAGICSVVGKFATLTYLSKLARRIPDDGLSDRARLLTWGIAIPMAALVVLGSGWVLAITASRAMRSGVALVVIGLGFAAAGVTLLVFEVMYVFLLVRFSTKLREATAVAESTWTRTVPPPAGPLATPLAAP